VGGRATRNYHYVNAFRSGCASHVTGSVFTPVLHSTSHFIKQMKMIIVKIMNLIFISVKIIVNDGIIPLPYFKTFAKSYLRKSLSNIQNSMYCCEIQVWYCCSWNALHDFERLVRMWTGMWRLDKYGQRDFLFGRIRLGEIINLTFLKWLKWELPKTHGRICTLEVFGRSKCPINTSLLRSTQSRVEKPHQLL
jgi:CRISPR/Cas system-associated endoribonuclease Cas2